VSDAARRIAALSPEQRERLLRELAKTQEKAPAPVAPLTIADPEPGEEVPAPAPAPGAPPVQYRLENSIPELALPPLVPRPEERWQPFPLTDVQQMYWAGRSRYFDLWTPGGNVYIEYELPGDEWYIEKVENALKRILDHHPVLRLGMLPDGRGQLREKLPPYQMDLVDLRGLPPEEVEKHIEEGRERLRYHEGPVGQWPLFGFLIHFVDNGRIRAHVWFDCWLVDGLSRDTFWRDLFQVVHDPETELVPLDITYRDYAVAWDEIRASDPYRQAREYWQRRAAALPPPVDLPLTEPLSPRVRTRYSDQFVRLADAEAWARIQERAGRMGLTPSSVLIAAFVELLRAWNRGPRFFLSLEGTYWPPIHPRLREIVGNFNTIYILSADDLDGTFAERARRIHAQLIEILEHRAFSGFEVLREVRRRLGGGTRALSPVMFNSLVELKHAGHQRAPQGGHRPDPPPAPAPEPIPAEPAPPPIPAGPAPQPIPAEPAEPPPPPGAMGVQQFEETAYMPQLLMLPAVWEGGEGALHCKFQVVAPMFPEGVLEGMKQAFAALVGRLADDDAAWSAAHFSLAPAEQLAARKAAPAEPVPAGPATLHGLFAARAAAAPERLAVTSGGDSLTYGELSERADELARRLRALGAGPNRLVAVLADGGWQRAAAVLGTLTSGAACLPLPEDVTPEALAEALRKGEVRCAVTTAQTGARLAWPEGVRWLAVDGLDPEFDAPARSALPSGASDLAWVSPNWAAVEHRAAVATLLEVNRRLGLGPDDRLLALSPPASDLALWELLAPLAAGASVLLPAAGPLASTEGATVWSGPPAVVERLVSRLAGKLAAPPRLALLGRDAVPVNLPERLRALSPGAPGVSVVGLAGFPEAAAVSALDGRAIAGHTLHVLDHALEPRPDWVPGELYVGGAGLARGYWRDDAASRARFFIHPRTGERLFRTGVLARFLPGGELEALGREEEFAVNFLGYPAEPRRVEAVLQRHPGVRNAAVRAVSLAAGRPPRFFAWVVPGDGVDASTLAAYAAEQLPVHLRPTAIELVDELPLDPQGAVDRAALPLPAPPAPMPPDSSLESELAGIWKQVLQLDGAGGVGPADNFFEIGGDSFRAVLMLDRVRERFKDPVDLTSFFYEPTVRHLAGLLRSGRSARRGPSLVQRLTGFLRKPASN
jgi:non-ribosomal peptide synthetase component F